MAGKILFENPAPATQDAAAVEQFLKAMGYPVTRPDIVKLHGAKALVKSSNGKAYYFVTSTSCTCKAGEFGKMCRHRKALEAVLRAKEAEKKPVEAPRRSFKPDGWD